MPTRSGLRQCSSVCFAHMVGQANRGLQAEARRGGAADRFDRPQAVERERLGALLGRRLRRQAACRLRSRCRSAALCGRHARPGSTTSPRPRRCRSKPGATYVFDLGYYDYGWWANARCRLPHRHPLQEEHAARRHRGADGHAGIAGPVRPHRPSARAHGQEPQQPASATRCARSASTPTPARSCAS